jgi:uncharacterized protein YigE (DUF2233 family)
VGGRRSAKARARTHPFPMLMVIVALVCFACPARAEGSNTNAEPCRALTYGEADYVVCTIDLARYELRMFLHDGERKPYGGLSRLIDSPEGQKLVFAMNGGMYGEPIGL